MILYTVPLFYILNQNVSLLIYSNAAIVQAQIYSGFISKSDSEFWLAKNNWFKRDVFIPWPMQIHTVWRLYRNNSALHWQYIHVPVMFEIRLSWCWKLIIHRWAGVYISNYYLHHVEKKTWTKFWTTVECILKYSHHKVHKQWDYVCICIQKQKLRCNSHIFSPFFFKSSLASFIWACNSLAASWQSLNVATR